MNPISHFASWFAQAKRHESISDATAACLSTIGSGSFPDGRMVLMKGYGPKGFVFYTNLHSTKGVALRKGRRAALTFYWPPLDKQVRIQGRTQLVSAAEADAYWRSRPRLTQIGAWASKQSHVLRSRAQLLQEVKRWTAAFGKKPIPRPSYWTGVRIIPTKIEFWEAKPNRLHDRLLYTKVGGHWRSVRLYP